MNLPGMIRPLHPWRVLWGEGGIQYERGNEQTSFISPSVVAEEHCTVDGQGPTAKQTVCSTREQTSSSAHPPLSNSQDGRQKPKLEEVIGFGNISLWQVLLEGQLTSSQGSGYRRYKHGLNVRLYTS